MSDNKNEQTAPEEEIQDMDDVVELKTEDGQVLKFYHLATIEHKKRWFACFQPAEKIEGLEPDEVIIYEIVGDEGDESLVPVEDEALLDEVYDEFVKEMEECDDEDCDCHDHDHDDCDCGCDCCGDHKE